MTHVLLTNDDGYAAAGLQAARSQLLDAGYSVTVIAPNGNRSGMARSVTCRERVLVEREDGGTSDPVFSCTGTPVDCVRIGVFAEEFRRPDVVVSGINHGVNLGDDATYSGTLGAALEGAILGLPAVAFSQQDLTGEFHLISHDRHVFALAGLVPHLVDAVVSTPPSGRWAVNVNFPTRLTEPAVEVTRFGRLTYQDRWMRPERSEAGTAYWPYLRRDDPEPAPEVGPGTDFGALAAGGVSVTPISLDWQGDDAGRRLTGWAATVAAAAQTHLRRDGVASG